MVDDVERFVAVGDDWIGGSAHVGVFVGQEYTDHVILVEKDHESGYHEQEPGYSLDEVYHEDWSFVSHIEFFLVVDVIGSHFVDEGVIGTFSAELQEPLTLIVPEGLRCKLVEVAVVCVIGGTSAESVHCYQYQYKKLRNK